MNFRIRKTLPLAAILFGLLALPAIAQADHIKWHHYNRLEAVSKGGFAGVSCPTAKACIAVDETGKVVYTNDPRGGTKKWHYATIEKKTHGAFTGISCPSAKLCVAVDGTGQVTHSRAPLGGAKKWSTPLRVDTERLPGGAYAGLSGISCPTTKLCVAVDNGVDGGVLVSTDPTGGKSAWVRVGVGSNVDFDTVSCSSATLCVAGGSKEYYSVDPTGGAAAWHRGGSISAGDLTSLVCTTGTICVGIGFNQTDSGVSFATTKATTALSWKRTNIEPQPAARPEGIMDAISCSDPGFCVALDSDDNAYTSSHPGEGKWNKKPTEIRANPLATRSVLSCRGSICVALDSRGVETTGVISK